MAVELQKRSLWPVENTLAAAGTAEKMGAGGAADTFPLTVKFIEIGYVDLDCWIAPTEAALASAGKGAEGGRVFLKAESGGRILPWEAKEIWFENVTVAETPTLYINGMF